MRLFIALNLPEETKEKLEQKKQEIMASFPEGTGDRVAKWVKKENLHLTLAFLGEVKNEHLLQICQTIAIIAKSQTTVAVKISGVSYDTAKQPPRLIWASCATSEALADLAKALQGLNGDHKPFAGHITLARVKAWVWRGLNPEERPNIRQELNIDFSVKSVELMESKLKPQGPEYSVIQSFLLKK